jgi:hypothetical protein
MPRRPLPPPAPRPDGERAPGAVPPTGRAPWQGALEVPTAAPGGAATRSGPAPTISTAELERVTDKVMAAIDRRLVAQRERQGRG